MVNEKYFEKMRAKYNRYSYLYQPYYKRYRRTYRDYYGDKSFEDDEEEE